MSERYWALIPAAGVGRRMASRIPKQYLPLGGKMVLQHSLESVLQHPAITGAVLVLSADDEYAAGILSSREGKPVYRAMGGEERCESVRNGLTVLARYAQPDDWVLVHDAARPCLRREDLDALLAACRADAVGGLLACPACDTLKRTDGQGRVTGTIDRVNLWHAQTPQMFRLADLQQALQQAIHTSLMVTDEASAMEAAGHYPLLVEGHADNLKITRPEDLALAEYYLRQQERI